MPANNSAEAATEERRAKAWDLRVRGKTYREIGSELGVSHVTAWEDVKAIGDRIRSQTDESAEHHRAMQLQRLDKVISVLMPLVDVGDLDAMDRLDKFEKRRAALLGLDAPAKQELAVSALVASPAAAAALVRERFGEHAAKSDPGKTPGDPSDVSGGSPGE